ncbi:NAP family protein [Phaeosphaeriaceae sp. PMI808]|nr:NAP family protein [Phaeosphaeriaceae sp. PMI808]
MAVVEAEKPEVLAARFEELSVLETEFENAELELIRISSTIHAPLYKKRAEFITRIPHFWSLVFEQAPPEIDNYILPTDAKVFADCLDTFDVSRFEIDDPKGSPRSICLKFGFKENEYFQDKVLEKKFWFRQSKDWAGLVSEPVRIHWKKGKDLTGGLTEAAYELGEARKKLATDTASSVSRQKETQLPEYQKLAQKIETSQDSSISFFGVFAFVSGYRWISAEESEAASKEHKERLAKIVRGEKVDDDDEEDEDPQDYQEVEVFPSGDEIVTIIAEDMWSNAIRYYQESFEEEDDEDLSEVELSASDLDPMDEDDSDGEVDIRALVGKGRKSDQAPPTPAKKQRKD